MNTSAAKLKRLVGIGYEFKLELGRFFEAALADPLFLAYDEEGNTPAARAGLLSTYNGCGPSMSFETEVAAYGLFEKIAEILVADDDVSAQSKTVLNELVVNATRYVGISEGDHESFHFMVAAYNLAAAIALISSGVVITGAFNALTLVQGGTGFTTDGLTDTATDVVFIVESTDPTNPTNYLVGSIVADIDTGIITSITSVTSGGDGFIAGEVVEISIDTEAAGQADATQTTPATATVDSITD